ncbi:MAG: hypothetical protein DHS80DRAFT_23548 [Piptocephalis tieghemiana]|nr:MAG: hypothetical protein DHS80DRAFT_23548 [Piptocephalis tieghemiana]
MGVEAESSSEHTSSATPSSFIDRLAQHHARLGTPFSQNPPVLAGHTIHLLPLYEKVTQAGGYKKLQETSGWPTIAQQLGLPPSFPSSSLASLYHRSLESFEQEDHWSRPLTLEEIKARKAELSSTSLPTSSTTTTSSSPSSSSVPNSSFTPSSSSTSSPSTRPSNPSNPSPAPVRPSPSSESSQWSKGTPGSIRYYGDASPSPVPPISLSTRPHPSQLPVRPPPVEMAPAQLLQGGARSRLILALRSRLLNEVDWAYISLVRLSQHHPIFFDTLPGLLDILLKDMQSADAQSTRILFPDPSSPSSSSSSSSSSSPIPAPPAVGEGRIRWEEAKERFLQVAHILRNLSFEDRNRPYLARHPGLIGHIRTLTLLHPHTSSLMELREYGLDTVENLSAHITLTGPTDPLLLTLRHCLLRSEDRADLLVGLRSITRLILQEDNVPALLGPPGATDGDLVGEEDRGMRVTSRILERLAQYLLLPDRDIRAATLDLLFQYTSISPAWSQAVLRDRPLIRTLVSFFSMEEQPTEPERAISWLRQALLRDPKNRTRLADMYYEYQSEFKIPPSSSEDTSASRPSSSSGQGPKASGGDPDPEPLSAADFLKAFEKAWPNAKIEVVPAAPGEAGPKLMGVGVRPDPRRAEHRGRRGLGSTALLSRAPPSQAMDQHAPGLGGLGPGMHITYCQWEGCRLAHQNAHGLGEHLLAYHVGPGESSYECAWAECGVRLGGGEGAWERMRKHLATHTTNPIPTLAPCLVQKKRKRRRRPLSTTTTTTNTHGEGGTGSAGSGTRAEESSPSGIMMRDDGVRKRFKWYGSGGSRGEEGDEGRDREEDEEDEDEEDEEEYEEEGRRGGRRGGHKEGSMAGRRQGEGKRGGEEGEEEGAEDIGGGLALMATLVLKHALNQMGSTTLDPHSGSYEGGSISTSVNPTGGDLESQGGEGNGGAGKREVSDTEFILDMFKGVEADLVLGLASGTGGMGRAAGDVLAMIWKGERSRKPSGTHRGRSDLSVY